MAPEFIDDDRRPTHMPTPAEVAAAILAQAEQWGELRRAGVIRDPGCDSVAAMLAEQDQAAVERRAL